MIDVVTTFRDYFSERAPAYAAHRPTYPPELVDYLAHLAPRTEVVWEAGCGSGQLTSDLARRFDRVIATDASEAQLAHAPPLANVEYRVATAEDSGLPGGTADLCVAAQAAHWFDLEAYWGEVRRVGRADAAVALVGYSRFRVETGEVAAIASRFYDGLLGTYWGPHRRLVERGYRDVPFPFREAAAPMLELRVEWTLSDLIGYVSTWSAVRLLEKAEGRDRFDEFVKEVTAAWGEAEARRGVRWSLAVRAGRLDGSADPSTFIR